MTPYIYPGLQRHMAYNIDAIEQIAINYWMGDPYSKWRKRENLLIRYLVYLIGWKNLGKSLSQLGVRYSQDHCTVINGKKKLVDWYRTNKEIRGQINTVLRRIGYTEQEIQKLMS